MVVHASLRVSKLKKKKKSTLFQLRYGLREKDTFIIGHENLGNENRKKKKKKTCLGWAVIIRKLHI